MKASIALLVSGLAAQQVTATWDRFAPKFKSPQYNDNECSDKQKSGFDWNDLPTGGFSGYGDFNFGGGWTCANSFGKRDSLTKRTFNSKCIKNKVGKQKPAAFDCGEKRKDGFSVTEFQVSVEYDADLEFHYKMPDNSVCKHVASCKKEGTTVKNTQCGGAKSVEVYLGNHNQKDKEDCEIGFHHIGFDCNPGYGGKSSTVIVSKPTPTPSKPAETPSKPAETPSKPAETPSKPAETPSKPAETPSKPAETPSKPAETPSKPAETPSKPAETPSKPAETPSKPAETSSKPAESSKPVESYPVPESSKPAESKPAESTPVPSVPTSTPVESKPVYSAPTPVPSSPAETPGYGPSSSALPQQSTSAGYSAPVPSSPATPSGGAPPCLPKCMNTWLEINSECKDNTDVNCYCKNPDFTKNVIECVTAWAKDDAETQAALSYLVGICASYVPQNPGIVTNCPSNVPLGPTSPPTPSAIVPSGSAPLPQTTAAPSAVVPPAVPVTTITYQTTITVPCSSEGSIIPGSSTLTTISTTVTVPQVVFTTASPGQPGATQSAPVNLVPGTPPPAQATPTAPYPIPSSLGTVVVPTGGVVPTGNATATAPAQFTGAASSVGISFTPAILGAVLAFFAL